MPGTQVSYRGHLCLTEMCSYSPGNAVVTEISVDALFLLCALTLAEARGCSAHACVSELWPLGLRVGAGRPMETLLLPCSTSGLNTTSCLQSRTAASLSFWGDVRLLGRRDCLGFLALLWSERIIDGISCCCPLWNAGFRQFNLIISTSSFKPRQNSWDEITFAWKPRPTQRMMSFLNWMTKFPPLNY